MNINRRQFIQTAVAAAVVVALAPRPSSPLVIAMYPHGDVRQYGAVGDGIHDDTAAIKAAISDAQVCGTGMVKINNFGGRAVYIPPGEFMATSPVQL